MPTLVLIRHSKAEAHRADDHSRELAARGRADAGDLRAWLLAQGVAPDRVVVSTATRTRQTWEGCSVGAVAPVYDDRVYEASVPDLLEIVGESTPAVQTLVVVGHNPGIEALAWSLDASDAARDRTNAGMRTSGAAVFSLASWDAEEGVLSAWH